MSEGEQMELGLVKSFETANKKRTRKRTKSFLDDCDESFSRRTIHNFHVGEEKVPTLKCIHKKLVDDMSFLSKTLDIRKQQSKHPHDTTPSFVDGKLTLIFQFRYSTILDRILLFIAVLFSMAGGVGTPLMMIFFGEVLEDMLIYARGIYYADSEEELVIAQEGIIDAVTWFIILCSILAAATFIVTYLSVMIFSLTCVRQISQIRSNYMRSVLNQDIAWYDVNQTGDFASRMTEDLIKVEDGIGDKVSTFCFFMGTFVSGLIIALYWGWELALICLISFPVSAVALAIVGWVTTKFSQKELDAYGAAGSIAEEVLTAIKTVFAFGGQQKEIDRYKVHLITACTNNIRRSLLTALSNALMMFFIFASYSLAFWYGIGLIIYQLDWAPEDRVYTPGTMITVFFCIMMSSFTLTMSAPYFQIFGTARGSGAKIFSVIDNEPIINQSKGNGKKIDAVKGNLKFKSVHFNYPARQDVKILEGVDIEIKPGETVAFVGSSGCGKSTCIQLLQRFYDPMEGEILLDDINLKEFDLDWYRSNIGVVGQEPVLFATTIAENIKLGNRSATQDDVERAAKKANAHSFIMTLPDGYQTLVGQRGSQMSGGQKQRIAIARALVREPKILLLDEATSALDTNSEAQVQRAIDAISKECTTIIVAHRLSTIKNADKIFVFSGGKIVEIGQHAELMDRRGVYHDLVINQVAIGGEPGKDNTFTDDQADKEDTVVAQPDEAADENDESMKSYSAIGGLLRLNKPEWWQLLIGGIGALVAGASMPVYAVVFGEIVGTLGSEDPVVLRTEGDRFSLYFLLIGIVSGVTAFLQWYMLGIAGEKLTKRVRGLMFETVLRQEVAWFDRKENGVGAICAKLSTDAANIQGAAGYPIMVGLNAISTITIATGLSLYFEWRLALVALTIVPIILIGTYFETKFSQMDNYGSKNAVENAAKIAVEAVANVRTVVAMSCEEVFYTMYTAEMVPHYRKGRTSAHFRGVILGLSRSLIYFAYGIAFFYGGHLVVNDGLDVRRVFQVSEALISAAMSIGSVMAFAPNFQKALIAANKMFVLVNRTPEIRDGPNSTHTGWSTGDITYEGIKFVYPTRPGSTVLENFNLQVLTSKTVALVGPSGCGKSTLVQLLQRFYDPVSGNVNIDAVNLRDYKIMALRTHMGIVSQEPNLFDRTIGDNIAYGDNTRLVSTDEILGAAQKANIHNFIASLPLGYDTRLGEKGTQLSGGQKQRVAIARALIRNPRILLLDEATSALDTESEKVVQAALDEAKVGRTCITIAHRLTTIQDADLICVVNRGEIIEQGTHQELLALGGLYHKLYTMQQR
ncbi:hypothetical protein Trydic_g9893 [Trypoxylus dichotomus]